MGAVYYQSQPSDPLYHTAPDFSCFGLKCNVLKHSSSKESGKIFLDITEETHILIEELSIWGAITKMPSTG
jgi:hypothetical protein